MTHDIKVKRAILIGKSVEVLDSLSFAAPSSVLRALQINCSSYYGSLAGWELGGAEAYKFYGVWRLNMLLAHNLPRETHRFFLPMLAPEAVSAKGEILARSVAFFQGRRTAPNHEVVTANLLLARHRRSMLVRNIAYVMSQSGQDPWMASPQLDRSVVMKPEAVEPPPENAWRLPYLAKLLAQREQLHTLSMEEEEGKVQQLIDSLCKS